MTTQSAPAPSGLEVMRRAGFSDEQIGAMLRAVMPQVSQITNSELLLEDLAHRLAATGLTDDMSSHWARRLEAEFDDNPLARELVADLTPQLHAGPVSAAEGARLSRAIERLLAEIRKPNANVINTTARVVGENGPVTTSGDASW